MTSTARNWPLSTVVPLPDLGPLAPPISKDDGQSKSVSPLERHDGWLVKLYRSPVDSADSERLDALITLPETASDRDRALLSSSTSWPVARITGTGNETVGCVIPTAPANFRATLQASATQSLEKYLDVDWLAQPNATLVGRSLRVPSVAERLKVCRNVVAVAACLERHRIVYSDWSYSNTFWDPLDHLVFVIDVDGCGRRSIPNICQPQWEDPLTARTAPADSCTDRFRVALLVARCLTGQREVSRALHGLADVGGHLSNAALPETLLDMLLAEERRHRPTLDTLLTVMDGDPRVRWKLKRLPLPPLPAPAPDPPSAATAGAGAGGPRTIKSNPHIRGQRQPEKQKVSAMQPTSASLSRKELAAVLVFLAVVIALVIVATLHH
jgi:hypothetical protein